MYKNLVNVAREIIKIANERAKENEKEKFISLDKINFSDFDMSYSDKLTDILMNLTLEEVKALQSIMYLGRDKDYKGNTADEIFTDYYNYISSLGVNKKHIEVRQMVSKIPLGEYLTEGYRILGINL